ncbi:diguanylate cyclase domain-containing protein [Methylophaga sp.]|uniref:sensor domain-containing diguanylate cyclase n=1 Tax=Methylophaga sp. TaxID=2024840 RepID=UPI003F698264
MDINTTSDQSTNVMQPSMALCVRLMEHLVTAAFVLDSEGQVIIWNKACEHLTGIPSEEIVGTKQHWQAFYEHERVCLADVILKQMDNIPGDLYESFTHIQGGAEAIHAENWCSLPHKKETKYLSFDAGAVFDEKGELSAVVETMTDMTDLKLFQSELQELASQDALTGLANRRSFDEHLASMWQVLKKQKEPFTLMMIDIDHFKFFNDTYGHQNGDQCLQRVATVLSDSLKRLSDRVYRYGGEEFAVLLPATNETGAKIVANRINQSIRDLNLKHENSPISDVVTVSIGVNVAKPAEQDTSPERALGLADSALYDSKERGRNTYTLKA